MDAITSNSQEIFDLIAVLEQASRDTKTIRGKYRPALIDERYYTSEEICTLLHLSKRTLQNYRDDGTIPYTKIGEKILYQESDITRILEENYFPEIR